MLLVFFFTLGPVYKEFDYNEFSTGARRFNVIENNIENFGYSSRLLLYMSSTYFTGLDIVW